MLEAAYAQEKARTGRRQDGDLAGEPRTVRHRHQVDDGETYSEPWGSKDDTELAVLIRSRDIRRKVK